MADTKDVTLTREEIYEHCHALSLIYDTDLTIDEARAGLRDAPIHVVRRIKESVLEMRYSDGWDVDNLLVACEERLDDMQPHSEAEIEKLRARYGKALDLLIEVSSHNVRNGGGWKVFEILRSEPIELVEEILKRSREMSK